MEYSGDSIRLNKLVALVHQDDGKHTEDVGIEQSYDDACAKIIELQEKLNSALIKNGYMVKALIKGITKLYVE